MLGHLSFMTATRREDITAVSVQLPVEFAEVREMGKRVAIMLASTDRMVAWLPGVRPSSFRILVADMFHPREVALSA
jgi:hypothetical protein